jgi:hypothetical protein
MWSVGSEKNCEVFSDTQKTEAQSSFKDLCSVDQLMRPHAPNIMITRCFKGYEKRGL